MNVPSQYKGFSKLPEDVQRKMDPDLAQKYMGGGSVMARPLFRQAGGPVAAQMPMPQQQMPMDPALMDQAAMIQNTVADQANTMTAEYIQNQLSQLDSAETSEQAINAIRGNEKSIEERYRELAELVGEEDAGQTPQSVLTLVQPVMLMTEQGAMDSGLGQLMQGLIGEVDMMTEGGEPTDMGQGIGSLMMAGAAEEPMGVGQQPVANFSQGGAVQRFQAGGEASRLQQIYSEMLPVYQSILGDLDERRRLTQSQILFDIADRAGAFAAGIDPRTGQRISGSPAAQLAGAMSGLGGQIGERLGSLEEADQRLRLAALQGAQSEYSAERAAARAAAGRERGIGNAYEAVDAQGNVIATEFLANRDDLDAFRAAYPDATIRVQQGAAALGDLYDVVIDGQVVTTVPLGTTADYNRILEQYPGATIRESRITEPGDTVIMYDPNNPEQGIPVQMGTPEYNQALLMGYRTAEDIESQRGLTTEERLTGSLVTLRLADGTEITRREDDPEIDRLIVEEGAQRITTPSGQEEPLDPLINPELMAAYGRGETSAEDTALIQAAIADISSPVFNPQTGQFETPTITPLVQAAEEARNESGRLSTVLEFPEEQELSQEALTRDLQLTELGGAAFGTRGFFNQLANSVFALVDADAPAPATQQGAAAVNALNEDAKVIFRDLTAGRSQEAVNQFATILPVPARITDSPSSAAAQVEQVIQFFNAQIDNARNSLATGVASQTERQRLEAAIIRGETMVRAYRALKSGIEQGPAGPAGVDPAQFRR